MKRILLLTSVITLIACTSKPVDIHTVYQDRIIEKEVPVLLELPKALLKEDNCPKPKRVEQLLDLDNANENDLYKAFESSYLNYLKCYKTIKSIKDYQNEVGKTYEIK